MPTHDVAASTELRFLLDRCFAAHQANRPELADALARAAEAIMRSSFPEIADDIARAASRKGRGHAIGARLVQHLDAPSAACVAMVLMVRGARKPAVNALVAAFGHHPEFVATTRMLCRRVFDGIPALASSSMTVMERPTIEVAAPAMR